MKHILIIILLVVSWQKIIFQNYDKSLEVKNYSAEKVCFGYDTTCLVSLNQGEMHINGWGYNYVYLKTSQEVRVVEEKDRNIIYIFNKEK